MTTIRNCSRPPAPSDQPSNFLISSAADVPGLETADGTVTTHEQKPGAGEWSFEVVEGAKDVVLEVTR